MRGAVRFVALALLGGCGRIDFAAQTGDSRPIDARPCLAPVGHDEDLDTIDDACDVCPHVADPTQDDADQDGVGNACDLDAAAEHIALFDPFTQARPDWTYLGATFANDAMQFPGVGMSIGATLVAPAPAIDVFEIGAMVGAGGPGQRQISLQVDELTGAKHYYCELFDGGASMVLNFTYTFDGSGFTQVDSQSLPGRLETGAATVALVHTPPTMRCIATWKGTHVEVSGMIPADIAAEQFEIAVNNVDAAIAYFVRISTP